jgi:aldehyde dehydrogenase (NAD+)
MPRAIQAPPAAEFSEAARALLHPRGTYVRGEWVETGAAPIEIIDPSTGTSIGTVEGSGVRGVELAVAAARETFDSGSWSGSPHAERAELLRRLARSLEAHADEFTEFGVRDVGTPVTLSRGLHALSPAAFIDFYAEAALRGPLGGYEESLGLSASPVPTRSTLYREPIGVVAAITAYNFPLLITAFKVGAALAAGCTVVLMPSPQTLTASLAFMRCIEEAGFPPGVVNLVTGGADVGEALTLADGVDMVTFTGSVPVGKSVMMQAARGLKKVVLELGGKSPNILLPSADVQAAVGPSILRFTRNAGQGCGATTRTLVPRDRYDEYAAAAAAFMATLRLGDPRDPSTDIGPLISAAHRERVRGFVDRALDDGADVLAEGTMSHQSNGFFYAPKLLGGVAPESEICQEEVFGPVGVLIPYDSVEHAVSIANGTRFGLNANIWGEASQAERLARSIKAGTVTINGGGADRPDAPWPGTGDSGVGVDRGIAGFSEFFSLRHVQVRLGE